MPPKVFISYSQQDTDFKDELLKTLDVLKHRGQLTTWHDQDIEVGHDISIETNQAIETCQVVLLLISANYFSDCLEEYEHLLSRKKNAHLLIFPIFIKHCLHEEYLINLKGLNDPKQPIESLTNSDQNKMWTNIAKRLIVSLKSLETNSEILDFKQQLKKLKQAAAQKSDELDEVFDEIRAYLKYLESKGNFDEEEHFPILENFLLDKSDAIDLEKFIEFCQHSLGNKNTKKPTHHIDYNSFSKRLKNGEVTLFLGIQMDAHDFAQQFDQMDCTNGLAEACEQIELKESRKTLIKELCQHLNVGNTPYLYELLSSIEEPLLIISTHYNDNLEQFFRKKHKKYVKVLQHWQRDGFAITQAKSLILEYSDREKIESCLSEELADKKILESGYSLIYKLRGCLRSQYYQESGEETFILSEYEHLDFSRLIKIPEHIISKLRSNYLWFLGHHLQSWEERMLIRVVLNRVSAKSPIAIQDNASEYIQKYWHDINNVTAYPIVLTDFIKNLRDSLEREKK